METQEANVVVFRLNLNSSYIEETIYISDEAFEKLPLTDDGWRPNIESIIPEYFTKEKIDEFKKKLCEQIMNSDNPFSIYEVDTDYYPVEKDKIWK